MDYQGTYRLGRLLFEPNLDLAATMPAPSDDISFDGIVCRKKQIIGEGSQVIGVVDDHLGFSRDPHKIFVNGQGIKFDGSTQNDVPDMYSHFMEAIQKIAAYEMKYSRFYKYKNALLTVRQSVVKQGFRQDSLDWHLDSRTYGITGKETRPFTDHIYLVADRNPTMVQKRSLRDAFNELSSPDAKTRGIYKHVEPYDITMMTNFCYHRSTEAPTTGARTFMRIIYQSPTIETLQKLPVEEKKELGLSFLL